MAWIQIDSLTFNQMTMSNCFRNLCELEKTLALAFLKRILGLILLSNVQPSNRDECTIDFRSGSNQRHIQKRALFDVNPSH